MSLDTAWGFNFPSAYLSVRIFTLDRSSQIGWVKGFPENLRSCKYKVAYN